MNTYNIYAGTNNSYIINEKDLNSIHGIEALTQEEVETLYNKLLNSEKHNIKGFDVYFIDLGGYFGFSALVFGNNHHIYYANDYELHHKHMTREELRTWYIDTLNHKLYSESELLNSINDYDEYRAKEHFIRNYWIQQFDHFSMFAIISTPEQEKAFEQERNKYKYTNNVSFCYVNDLKALKNIDYLKHLDIEYKKLKSDNDKFRTMIRYELRNHEACITYDYTDALGALGLSYNKLTAEQQRIVRNELNKCIEEYNEAI